MILPMPRRSLTRAALVVLLTSGVLTACGDDEKESSASRSSQAQQAFLQAMIPHHSAAIDMARVAQKRAQRAEIKKLADAIVSSQSDEISQMETIHKRLFDSEIRPDPEAAERLGLTAEEAGVMHTDAAAALQKAKPFDRAFIDEMVPHHLGAIRMARAVLVTTTDTAIKGLANAIIDAQSREISQMRRWRVKWYGAAAPETQDGEQPDTEEHGSGHSG